MRASMSDLLNFDCRFCATTTKSDEVYDLVVDLSRQRQVMASLASLNSALQVDMSETNPLPKTVCYKCFELLVKTRTFISNVQEAQKVLNCKYQKDKKTIKHEESLDLLDLNSFQDAEKSPEQGQKYITLSPVIKVESKPRRDKTSLNNRDFEDKDSDQEGFWISTYCNVQILANDSNNDSSDCEQSKEPTWKDYTWVCSFCGLQFSEATELRSHAMQEHNTCYAYMCPECTTMHKDFESYTAHVKRHQKHLKHFCHYCDFRFTRLDNSKVHIEEHLTEDNICEACGDILPSPEDLLAHKSKYNVVTVDRTLKKPRKRRGSPVTKAERTCPTCQKVCCSKNGLTTHLQTHTARERNFSCDQCGRSFYSKGSLTSHMSKHSAEKPHTCRICSRSFQKPYCLRQHVIIMHSANNADRPFSCQECGKAFRIQKQLKMHMTVHSDFFPHVCQYCNKGFRHSQHLKVHMRQHTGAKPYSCDECCVNFTNWPNYNKHMKRRHGRDMSKKKRTKIGTVAVDPTTGKVLESIESSETDEWRKLVLVPSKRGKKPKTSVLL